MQQGDKFNFINIAYKAIKQYVLNNSKLFKLKKSNKKQYSIVCKEIACDFAI